MKKIAIRDLDGNMKLHVMSDLHLDLLKPALRTKFFIDLDKHLSGNPCDTIVLAGDIFDLGRKIETPELIKIFCKYYKNVIFVSGNHEYYGLSIVEGDSILRDLQYRFRNFHVLGCGTYEKEIEGIKFSGGMGWYQDCKDYFLKKSWSDYRFISDMDPEAYGSHLNFVEKGMGGDVIISHTFPTVESIGEMWRDSKYNVFFCMYLSKVLDKMEKYPKLWIHGHTHSPFDYVSGYGYRVYCNPKGYEQEGDNPNFWSRINLEINK